MVMSANGLTTRGDESPSSWASVEDQEHFAQLREKADVIIMGRKTYEEVKSHIKNDGKLRIVMSRATHEPRNVLAELKVQGHSNVLLVGGSELNATFFEEKLIDEIYLTIEPELFAEGLPLAQGLSHGVELELITVKQLNPRGTLLLHYRVHH